jgi:hypothetical protein
LLTPWSAAFFLVTALIPFAAVAALAVSLRRRPETVARFTGLYAKAVAIATVACAIGLIVAGWWAARTWV